MADTVQLHMARDQANAVIDVQNLTKRFGSLTAVSTLSLTVKPQEIVGFLGPNGAGKTTTIRVLMGFIKPTAGQASVLGGDLWRNPQLRSRVGYLPGDFRADPAITGSELFRWFGELRGGAKSRLEALVERLRLDPTRKFGSLSKGNRQKVGLVQAFMHEPDVLILDEPTTGLDPLIQREFLQIVRESAAGGAAVLFSSHVLPEVERIAARVAIIREGRLVKIAAVDDLLDSTRRRLELHFASPVNAEQLKHAQGVVDVEVDGRRATLTINGPVGPALRAATESATLLRVSSPGDELEDLFISVYDGDHD